MAITVREFAEKMDCKIVAGESGSDNTVNGMYIGDLLSWVMGNAKEGDAWVTIMGHVNVVAVALLTVVSCVVICESAEISPQTIEKANLEGIPILSGKMPAFETARKYIKLSESPE